MTTDDRSGTLTAEPNTDPGHRSVDTQTAHAGVGPTAPAPASSQATPIPRPPARGQFDLHALIRDAFEETPNHFEAWTIVQAHLDAETVWLAVAQMGPDYVRHMATPAKWARTGRKTPTKNSRRMPGTPRKKAAADERWRHAMALPVRLSDDGKLQKLLGECLLHEVRVIAERRHKQAADLVAMAERFDRVAEKMRVYRATKVSDLDPGLFWEAWEGNQ